MSDCPRLFEVEAMRDGRLSGTERANFERHLTHCSDCAREARALDQLATALHTSEITRQSFMSGTKGRVCSPPSIAFSFRTDVDQMLGPGEKWFAQAAAPAASAPAFDIPLPRGDFRAAIAALNVGDNHTAALKFESFLRTHPLDARAEGAAYLRVIALSLGFVVPRSRRWRGDFVPVHLLFTTRAISPSTSRSPSISATIFPRSSASSSP